MITRSAGPRLALGVFFFLEGAETVRGGSPLQRLWQFSTPRRGAKLVWVGGRLNACVHAGCVSVREACVSRLPLRFGPAQRVPAWRLD